MAVSVRGPELARLLFGWQEGGSGRIHDRLAVAVSGLLLDGRVPLHARLPSERDLASALHISRATVNAAYARLRAEGFAVSRQGAATWTRLPSRANRNIGPLTPEARRDPAMLDLAVAVAGPVPEAVFDAFATSVADLHAELARECEASGHGYHPAGFPSLREAVAERYATRGVPTSPEQILATVGAQGGIHLVTRALLRRGDPVLVEEPTYPNAVDAMRRMGARLIAMPVTSDGWDINRVVAMIAHHHPRMAYLIPDFHNPTGALMPASDRERLLAAARCSGTTLLIDETHIELALEDQRLPPPVAAFDGTDHVISVGSLSKVFWGGLRVGWLRTSTRRVAELTALRSSIDLAGPVMEQLATARLLRQVEELLPTRRKAMRDSRDALTAALSSHVPHWTWTTPTGGLSVWARLDRPVSTMLADAAEQWGVRLVPGSRFGIGDTFERFLRLPFSLPPDDIAEAIRRISKIERDL